MDDAMADADREEEDADVEDDVEADDDDVDDDAKNKPQTEDAADKPSSDSHELLSPRAELFRSKLMNEFHLLENIGAGGAMDGSDEPHLHTRDALDDGLCRSMMMKEPNALIQFQVYSDKVRSKIASTSIVYVAVHLLKSRCVLA